jgi:hypothetical protein
LQQLKTSRHYKFPIKIAFAKGQTLELPEYVDHCLFLPMANCVGGGGGGFSGAPSFDSVTVAIIEGHRQRVENDRPVT